jgi:hypothetical protein
MNKHERIKMIDIDKVKTALGIIALADLGDNGKTIDDYHNEECGLIANALHELERLQRNLDSVEKTIRESFPEFMPLMTLIRTGKGL